MKKIIPAVLLVSLVANIALAVALSRRATPPASTVNPAHVGAKGEGAVGPTGDAVSAKVSPAVWAGLASDDLKQLTANLTAAGFPREAVRAAINGVLDERYRPRLDALYAKLYGQPFWEREPRLANPEISKELRAIETERLKITRELLGTNIANDEARRNRQARFGQLPDDKLDAIEAIVNDYRDLAETSGITWGAPMPWDRERRALVEAETRKDIVALLTPDELAAYDLRASRSASMLRSRMEYFKPTMAEFQAVLPLQQAFDAKYPGRAYFISLSDDQRRADDRQLAEQIKTALGEARYAEYQRAQDGDYRAAHDLAEQLSLPVENAGAVYAMKQEYQNRANGIRSDRNQTAEQRTAALNALAAEAQGKMDQLLTPEGAKTYNRTAFWLQNINRQMPARGDTTTRIVRP